MSVRRPSPHCLSIREWFAIGFASCERRRNYIDLRAAVRRRIDKSIVKSEQMAIYHFGSLRDTFENQLTLLCWRAGRVYPKWDSDWFAQVGEIADEIIRRLDLQRRKDSPPPDDGRSEADNERVPW